MVAEFHHCFYLNSFFFFHYQYLLIHAARTTADAITSFLALPLFRFIWAILVSIHGIGFSFRLGLHFSGGTTRYLFFFRRRSISLHLVWQAIC